MCSRRKKILLSFDTEEFDLSNFCTTTFVLNAIVQVADPTILLEDDNWENIAVCPEMSGYIMVFTLSYAPNITDYAPWNNRGSRINDLLAWAGLSEHRLNQNLNEDYSELSSKVIDHKAIKALIEKERTRSRDFLMKNV